jgi:trans-aconitate methyltransferase
MVNEREMTLEFDGKKYAQASAHQKEWGTTLIAKLNLKGTEHVLDLGCGDGALTAQIAALVPGGRVMGIDASEGMIAAAQPKVCQNLRFVRMDINDLRFSAEFDIAFSNATLHWVRDHKRLYANVSRLLRPGGRIRFNFAAEGNCSHFFRVAQEAISREEFSVYFENFEWPWYMPAVDTYAALVASSGFAGVRVWGENADRFFPDAEAMIRWIDQPSIVPLLACVAEEHKRQFRDYVVGRMLGETQQSDGRCFETFRRINVSAQK